MFARNRLENLRQLVKDRDPLIIRGHLNDISFATAEMGAQKMSPITFTPIEQIRYEANEQFGAVLSEGLMWLVRQKTAIHTEELDRRCAMMRQNMTTQQQEIFDAVMRRVKRGMEFCTNFDPERLSELVTTLKEAKYISKQAVVEAEVRPLSIVISIVDHDGYGVTDHGGSIPLNHVLEDATSDPIMKEAMRYCIITHDKNIEHIGYARGKEEVIAHELFHNLYKLMIVPEQKVAYKDPLRKKLFNEAKDEMLAYLVQGIWEFHAESLFFSLRQEKHWNEIKSEVDNLCDLWGMVARNTTDITRSREECEKEADIFIDEIWNAMRAIGYLRFAGASCEDGVQAIIATQSFKEMVFALLAIKDKLPNVRAKNVWDSFQKKEHPRAFVHELRAFLEEYSWLRLPQLDHPDHLLAPLHDYITNVSSSDKTEDVTRLQEVYEELKRYFG